jgi:Protein of unknown function (DUF2721)
MQEPSSIGEITHLIQLAVAPVFLLAGIGSLLNVLAGRLARVFDRARKIEAALAEITDDRRVADLRELAILDRRMSAIHGSILLCTSSALLVCLLVAILFVANLVSMNFAKPVAILFVMAMVALICGLLLFLVEITIARRSVRVRIDLSGYR